MENVVHGSIGLGGDRRTGRGRDTDSRAPQHVGGILSALVGNVLPDLSRRGPAEGKNGGHDGETRETAPERPERAPSISRGEGVFDLDLAEFPLFRFSADSRRRRRFEPLDYADTITARDGTRVRREWRAIPGPAGVGGPSAQLLLFDLIQIYAEQEGDREGIRYGTMRSILTRRGLGHPSRRDYERLRRDLEILRGYEIRCTNGFWDARAGCYVDRHWRLFPPTAEFPQGRANSSGELEVGEELRLVASIRGFFPLGFDRKSFYRLRPLEQRLALYLARKFRFQSLHRRYVEELARALPIEAARPRDLRRCLDRTARRLLELDLPIMGDFRILRSRSGRWIAEFNRRAGSPARPIANRSNRKDGAEAERYEYHLGRIADEIGNARDRVWWLRCLRRLGPGPMDRALGQLREACLSGRVRNRGALLTKILKDLAAEAGLSLR